MSRQLKVVPIPGQSFGAVVSNVDLATIDAAQFAQLEAVFLEFGVLVFPNQHLSQEAQTAFARRFGEPMRNNPKKPEAEHYDVSNKRWNGKLLQESETQSLANLGNRSWHTDRTYMQVENLCSMLSAIEVPSRGGETEFADMKAAYEAFDQATKERILKLQAYHSNFVSQAVLGLYVSESYKDPLQINPAYHGEAYLRPLVKKHPQTGVLCFHAGRHAFGIPGMSLEESEKFLDDLHAEACQPPRLYLHKWVPGELVLWDQRRVMHRARPFDPTEARILRGTGVLGDPVTERSLEGTKEALLGPEVLAAEMARLKGRKGFVPGTLPKSAL